MFSFPKLKYQAAEEHPGYKHVRVEDPAEEEALGEGWHDTPGEMRAATAPKPAPAPEGDSEPEGNVASDAATDAPAKPKRKR